MVVSEDLAMDMTAGGSERGGWLSGCLRIVVVAACLAATRVRPVEALQAALAANKRDFDARFEVSHDATAQCLWSKTLFHVSVNMLTHRRRLRVSTAALLPSSMM